LNIILNYCWLLVERYGNYPFAGWLFVGTRDA